ncbi:MAG: DUF3617 family protein [Spartobacteria bacterium]|nr:DUF3617 family protein [Spartobacteria bacterium]
MNKLSIRFIILCVLGAACCARAQDLHQQLQGNWRVDQEASWREVSTTEDFQAMPPEQQASQETMIKKMFADMRVTFTPDIAIFSVQTTSRQSPYTVVSAEGNTLSIDATINGRQEQVTICFDDPNRMSFLPKEDKEMRFILVRE